ncbi:unnamed protein product, partial [Mesorhabditis spiculigera]
MFLELYAAVFLIAALYCAIRCLQTRMPFWMQLTLIFWGFVVMFNTWKLIYAVLYEMRGPNNTHGYHRTNVAIIGYLMTMMHIFITCLLLSRYSSIRDRQLFWEERVAATLVELNDDQITILSV